MCDSSPPYHQNPKNKQNYKREDQNQLNLVPNKFYHCTNPTRWLKACSALQVLLLSGINIIRYIFIFWLKNPVAFKDDFWNLFVNIWIMGFAVCAQVMVNMTPGREILYYYICTGRNPVADDHIPLKRHFHMAFIVLISAIFQVAASIRVFFFKRKLKTPSLTPAQMFQCSLNSGILMDLTTSAAIILIFFFMLSLIHIINFTPAQDFNCFPNYLYEYTLRMMIPEMFSFAVVFLHYYRHPSLRSTIRIELGDLFSSFG